MYVNVEAHRKLFFFFFFCYRRILQLYKILFVSLSFIFKIHFEINFNFATRVMQRKRERENATKKYRFNASYNSNDIIVRRIDIEIFREKNLIYDATTSLYQQSLKLHYIIVLKNSCNR